MRAGGGPQSGKAFLTRNALLSATPRVSDVPSNGVNFYHLVVLAPLAWALLRRITVDYFKCSFALFVAALAAGALLMAGSSRKVEFADLVLKNGKIATLDPAKPTASALAARGDVIVAVGTDEEIQPFIGPSTRVIDLNGLLASPGFIDSHGHLLEIGSAKMMLDLTRARNWDEVVAKVAEAARKAAPGQWITGRGWHQEKWDSKPSPAVEGFPVHDALSKAAPNNPVILTHASAHALIANAKAMELAGITRSTSDPAGGKIVRDAKGNPTGVFEDGAAMPVRRAQEKTLDQRSPEKIAADNRQALELAIQDCLSKGVTTFHDAGSPFLIIDLYKTVADEGKLGLRLYVMINEKNSALTPANLSRYRLISYGDKRLTVRAIKRVSDGALGPRSAWLLEPYADQPSTTGLNTTSIETIAETAKIAIENNFQLCTHAIGDRANREVLNIYEDAFKSHPERKDLRWRVEHAQHLSLSDIPRFGQLDIIASMQGIHCTSDAVFVLARLGSQRAEEGAYVWQKLMKSGALIANGTDAPVEDVDPIPNFYALVSRKLRDGSVFFADQRMSRIEALKAYTANGAYAAFEENSKGTLTIGKLADITILSKDILSVPEDEIPTAVVKYTIVGGKILYQRPN